MPAVQSAGLTILRSGGDVVKRYLSVDPMTTIFTAQVNGAPAIDDTTGGIYQITYDNGVGTYGNIASGMTLWIGTTAGAHDVGITRIRLGANETQINIANTAPAELPIEDGHYLTVKRSFQPWYLKPRLVPTITDGLITDFTEYHDFSSQTSGNNVNIQPVINIVEGSSDDGLGYKLPKLVGFVDPGQTYRTVSLTAVYSYSPVSATIGYTWFPQDCTITVGTANSVTITMRVPVGFRWVMLLGLDSNGVTLTRYLPLWTHDANNMPLTNFHVLRDETEAGREMTFEFFGSANEVSETIFPPGAAACYWEDADFTGGAAPEPYRSHTLGWRTEDAIRLNASNDRYQVTIAGLATWLDKFNNTPQELRDPGATADKIYEMEDITGDRFLHYLLREFSTAPLIANFFPSSIRNLTGRIEVPKGSLWAQLEEAAARNLQCSIACDSLGGIWVRPQVSYLPRALRAHRATTMALDSRDWRDDNPPVLRSSYVQPVGYIAGSGSYYNGTSSELLESNAPGRVRGYGVGEETMPMQVLPLYNPQVELNRMTGFEFARQNRERQEATVPLLGNLDVFEPAWNEQISLTWTEAGVRGITLNADKFIVRRVSIEHARKPDEPPKRITLTVEPVTHGVKGETVEVVGASGLSETPATMNGLVKGVNNVAAITVDGILYITADFQEDTPTSNSYTLSGTIGSSVLAFVADPFSPGYVNGTGNVNGKILTTTKIWDIDDIFGARTLTERHSLSVTADYRARIKLSRLVDNWGNAIVSTVANTVKSIRTTNGTSWTEAEIDTGTAIDDNPIPYLRGLHQSEHTGSLVFSAIRSTLLAYSIDYGASFLGYLVVTGETAREVREVHIPYENAADNFIYFSTFDNADAALNVYKAYNQRAVNITPSYSSYRIAPYYHHALHTCDINQSALLVVGHSYDGNRNAVLYSENGGDTWITVAGQTPGEAFGGYTGGVVAGDDDRTLFLWSGGAVYYTESPYNAPAQKMLMGVNLTKRVVGICGGTS